MNRLDQIAHGWVAMLDVDLELAQRMLRLPPAQRPLPPCGAPAVTELGWAGEVLTVLSEIPPAAADEPPPVPRTVSVPRGAYARRARKGS